MMLHSPLSPLSLGSALFPDGIMTPTWIAKHQEYVPACIVLFFTFTSDSMRNSVNDNQLKNEINSIKSMLQKSDYKSRFTVILIGDDAALKSSDMDDRLMNIRRGTGLDPKVSLFFIPPKASRSEVAASVQAVLTALRPICVEYYRDLTKHARRKKGRSTIPAPTVPSSTGASQPLSSQGWGVRYDFKLGVFAEFRQEMDAAGRHYGFALDSILGADGIFETMANWSPRWNETRLLADCIALRSLRCMLWNNQPSSAVQAWALYRTRMRAVMDRKGKGSSTYGWEAWESRWAKLMAELVQRSELPVFALTSQEEGHAIFALPEKSFSIGERLPPWYLLHHAGYWLKLAAVHAVRRRELAEAIPDEDRISPEQVPASEIMLRNRNYDNYLVPEPHLEYPLAGTRGYDHCDAIVELLNQASHEFFKTDQQRLVDQLHLNAGQELLRSNRPSEALAVLLPVWEGMSWRTSGWWDLISETVWALNEAAERCQDSDILVKTGWDLLNKSM
jgi:trafficking protein particle complex subunit 11